MPVLRAIITLIVVVVVIPDVMMVTIIGVLLIVIAVGIPRAYGNGNLGFRFRGNQSDKPQDNQDQEEILFHILFI